MSAHLPRCTIVRESCGGSNHWARVFQRYGHVVKLISPRFVKLFVKTNKNNANFPSDKQKDIAECLSNAEIPLKSVGLISISITTPLHNTNNNKKSLEILSDEGLISPDFAQEIVINYPNGHGGTMDLNHPFKGINALLMIAASNIFNLNAKMEKEGQQKKEDTYCGFKPGFLLNR